MLITKMFEDTDAVKHGTRILISKHSPHRGVENVGHILAVFPTVHFSKSIFRRLKKP
ncbi:MAG: hypothetical protein ACI9JK_001003 [Phycisphaerales bacterium]|jgi:hypothetical protein